MPRARRRISQLFAFPGDFSLDARIAAPELCAGVARWEKQMNTPSRVDRRGPVDVDSTQTMRALSDSELYDSHQPKWYAVQLVISERPINLDMMPRLDSFATHQLYALAAKHETGTWYALRLGFFPDEQSAESLCEHLRTYFSAATIVRVSLAEQLRFAQRTAAAAPVKKPASATAATPASATATPSPPVADTPVKPAASQSQTKRSKTLAQELLEEAREVQLGRNGKKQAPEQSGSWITRLFGRPNERPRSASRR